MEVSRELLFFFSALGAFNGLLMGLFFIFYKKPKTLSNLFLGGFLICLSVRIGKSVFFYFNPDLAFGFLQLGLTACFFIGPFLYFYFKSIYNNGDNLKKLWAVNILVLVLLAITINFYYPFESNIDLWRPHIINGIYFSWLGYSLLCIPYAIAAYKNMSSDSLRPQSIWDISLFAGNILIWLAFNFCGYTSYILGALLFTFLLYLLLLLLLFKSKKTPLLTKEKYKDKKIEEKLANDIIQRLEDHLKTSKHFTNSNLKLADLASELNILPHTLSQVLNDNLGKSFRLYLNEYRIEEAKKMILEHNDLTLEAIAYECGFNSKSTFYKSFKKITGHTPSHYQNGANSSLES